MALRIWVAALIAGACVPAVAADVDITTDTGDGLVLDGYSGTTAQTENGVTVATTNFNFSCVGVLAALCATTHAWTVTNRGTIGAADFGDDVDFDSGGSMVNYGDISGNFGNAIWIEGGTGSVTNNLDSTIDGAVVIGTFSNAACDPRA